MLGFYVVRQIPEWRREGTLDAARINTETSAPLAGPGATNINAIARAVGKIRERHLLQQIANQMNQTSRVLVVYGQGHLVEARKVLQQMLGEPKSQKFF